MCAHDPGNIITVHTYRVKLQLSSREGYTTCSHLQTALVLCPVLTSCFWVLSWWNVVPLLRVMLIARVPDHFCVRNLSSGRTFEGHGFRVTLTWCYLALSLKAEVLIPAGYSDPVQQHKSYCGHKQNPAETQLMQTKKLSFLRFWSSCAMWKNKWPEEQLF